MFDSKFLVTFLALMFSVIAICNLDKKKNIVEGIGMLPSMVTKTIPVARNTKIEGHPFFTVQNFQSQLPPRFNNTDYGANIRYNLPNEKHLAARRDDPLMMGHAVHTAVKSDARGEGNPFMREPIMKSEITHGNLPEITNEGFIEHQSEIPVGDMTTISPTGEIEQTIVYDRMIVANRNSRLRGMGDWIRGDLPIAKNETGWFQVSANPVIDLNHGALNAIAGPDNAVTQRMTAFMNNSVGTTTVAGMNLSNEYLASIGAGRNDINVTAFP